jgi:hypothetical protein
MKVTKTQFNLFCSEFRRWVEKFGLHEWELRFFLEDIGSNLASINADYLGRICKISFTKEWNDLMVLDDTQIKECAKHEAIELLTDDMGTMAYCRFVTLDEIQAARHTLVRRLEKLLL